MLTFLDRPLRKAAGLMAVLAVTMAVVLTTARTGPAEETTGAPLLQQAAGAAGGLSPLFARDRNGHLWDFEPTGTGGFAARVDLGGGYAEATAMAQTRISQNGTDLYAVLDDRLYYTAERGTDTRVVNPGWGAYDLIVSVGDMAGTTHPDLLARGKDGQLWLHQGKADGTFLPRVRVGTGWNGMDELTGRGDYTGDGKADLVARSTTGALYIYPGTGNATADAVVGARLTVPGTGWRDYPTLVSVGDNTGDGKPDLLAVDKAGGLSLLKGTGTATSPFVMYAKLATSGWTSYDLFF
ncbi:FG-GAP repeat domain-containing protein [Streptomyces acidiscabies]|uniref:FG-GAP repeat domain-containing protein n=1 Tax=Streptomyces acidiscabies TaxID=42234 RepID=UPI00095D063D|nr:VCBS repeat-containing protein [Streptomyces acidiscabies]GAV40759.1 FG-GAP repeat protein [Streptomyces acidiscabies]